MNHNDNGEGSVVDASLSAAAASTNTFVVILSEMILLMFDWRDMFFNVAVIK